MTACNDDDGNQIISPVDLPDSLLIWNDSTYNDSTISGDSSTPLKEANQWNFVQAADSTLPIERHEAAFVEVEGKFYLLGGRGKKNISIYDPVKNIWSKGATPPIEIHHFQPIVYNNKIYIFGAFTGGYPKEKPIADIYVYTPSTNKWSTEGKIPDNRLRGSAGCVLIGKQVYLICGIKNGHTDDHKKWFDVYDLETKEWKKLADAPRARDHFQAIHYDNKLYLIGGRLSKAATGVFKNTIKEVDVYDFTSKKWSSLDKGIPTKRAGTMGVVYKDEILIVGGEDNSQAEAFNEVEALNPLTNEWRSLPKLKEGRHSSGVINWRDTLYVASGSGNRGGEPELQTMECFYSE
ncbi:kelch repeat-containing protein [Algivirga pacifica]|uniref:Kelch repeat-containing protein n=1 Tax=Algivirga pacifica TaxID=1162670 RepID=A0ABP9DHA5_9BACT